MGFSPNGGGISGANDVALSGPANNQVLTFDSVTQLWKNATPAAGSVPSYANLPAGTTLTVVKSGSTWPARPTSRTDIIVQWKGPDPSPSIVASGTAGMLDNVDMRFITP